MIQQKDFFLLRQPLYSVDRLTHFYKQLTTHSLNDLLRQHYQDPLAQQAIFAASPALYERFQRWLSGETLPEQEKLLATLHKYFIRMCSRPTPYGLFAGCTVGSFGEQTQFRAGTPTTLRTHTRIDMDCLRAVCQWICEQPAVRPQLRLFPNSSLYSIGSSFRYIEQQAEDNKRNYFISAVEADSHLIDVLQTAAAGATIDELSATLISHGIQADETLPFIEQLIQSQLLVFEIEPKVTELHNLDRLIDLLDSLPNTTDITRQLRQLQDALQQSDRLEAYAQTRAWYLDRQIGTVSADLVQVDSFFDNSTLQLGDRPLQQVKRTLEKLMVLNQPYVCRDLEEFKRRFHTRYEDEEVPLALAIDAEFGIGYGTISTLGVGYAPLVDDLTFAASHSADVPAWDWWQTLVLDKYTHALRSNKTGGTADEISLTDKDLAYIAQKQTRTMSVPDSFFAFGTFLASSQHSLDEGDYSFNLLACKGPSALNLMSRFGEGNPTLTQHIRQCAAAEELFHPDVIMAEIVHLPENRVGNILNRPTIHQYEIPYMGQSSVDLDHQIPLSDLLVSVRNNKVLIRSKRLNQRVIPRLTNAHNFSQGLPIYRFLCDLQAQDSQINIAWNWGILRDQPYLPRVRYRNVIISRATWLLPCESLTPDNPLRLVAQLTAAGLPEQFVVAQGDNELYISLHTPESLELLAQEIRRQASLKSDEHLPQQDRRMKSGHIKLIEFLSTPDQCPLSNKRERFTHELIIPLHNPAASPIPDLGALNETQLQRKFSVGSEWFYLKVYTGEKTSDTLLIETIYPVVRQLLANRIVDEAFFVRYKDPDPHLRLRFKGNSHLEFYHHVVRVMEKALHKTVESGIVHRVQVDTYQRELERYGVEHMSLCETLFHYDSLSTLEFLAHTGDEFDENLRVAAAVRKIDRLLVQAGFSPSDCQKIMSELKEVFFNEFGATNKLRHQLNEKYRLYRQLLDQALDKEFPFADILDQWQSQQKELLRQLMNEQTNKDRLQEIICSLIHMIVNRVFPSKQRAYELVLYHCLARHYDSLKARQTMKPSVH